MRGYVYVGPFVCAASFLHRPCTSTSTQEQVVVDSTQTAACAFAAVAGIPIWRFGFPHKEAERLGGISSPKVGSGAGPNRGSVSLKRVSEHSRLESVRKLRSRAVHHPKIHTISKNVFLRVAILFYDKEA